MLTHLPAEKITLVLTQQNTPTDEENGMLEKNEKFNYD